VRCRTDPLRHRLVVGLGEIPDELRWKEGAGQSRSRRLAAVRGPTGVAQGLTPYPCGMPRAPRVSAREVIAALRAAGYEPVAHRGSHVQFRHPQRSGKVTIPAHGKEILKPKTLRSILTQAGIEMDAFVKGVRRQREELTGATERDAAREV
jgi:predicted RNA binding protein YcfA (HicA-like mRNA interferase family)